MQFVPITRSQLQKQWRRRGLGRVGRMGDVARLRALGDMVCYLTSNGARLCYDSSGAAQSSSSSGSSIVTAADVAAENAALIRPRLRRTPRAASTASPAQSNDNQVVYAYDPPASYLLQQQILAAQQTSAAAAAPTTSSSIFGPQSLTSQLTSLLPTALTDSTIITGYPNWQVLGAGSLALYLFLKFRKGRR